MSQPPDGDRDTEILERPALDWFKARMQNVRSELIRTHHWDPQTVDNWLVEFYAELLAELAGSSSDVGQFRTKVLAAFDAVLRRHGGGKG